MERIISTVRNGLDQRRFPWAVDDRSPSEAERSAAVVASAALMATQRLSTSRRNEGKTEQEQQVRDALRSFGFKEVERRTVLTLADAPEPGTFCMESVLRTRKADLLVGLWDGRTMPIECKVSNSATNSIKRLNNDAAAKAEVWMSELGKSQVIPTAVLTGVFKLHNLQDAQDHGLTLLWAHRLEDLTGFIAKTQP